MVDEVRGYLCPDCPTTFDDPVVLGHHVALVHEDSDLPELM